MLFPARWARRLSWKETADASASPVCSGWEERTIESFQGFFTTMGREVISKIVFVCSDMWEPALVGEFLDE
jgi:hypothetical protein